MLKNLKNGLKIVICHRSLYASLALAYAAGTTGMDEHSVKQVIAGLYILLMIRG